MTKHQARECVFLLLYEIDVRQDPSESLNDLFAVTEEALDLHFTERVRDMVQGVLAQQENLDAIITKYSPKRSLKRIPAINRSILRLALYELNQEPDTPRNVVISEAVTLTHAYAYEEDTSFVNGVLGAYVRDLDQQSTAAGEEAEHALDSGD